MPITINRPATARRTLERSLQHQATPFPVRRPRTTAAILLGGLVVGALLAQLPRLIKPQQPAPVATTADRQCRPMADTPPMPPLEGVSLEPQMPPELAKRWAPGGDLHKFLGPQLPKAPAPQPVEAPVAEPVPPC